MTQPAAAATAPPAPALQQSFGIAPASPLSVKTPPPKFTPVLQGQPPVPPFQSPLLNLNIQASPQISPAIQTPQTPFKQPVFQTPVQPLPPPTPIMHPVGFLQVLQPLAEQDGTGQHPATPLVQKTPREALTTAAVAAGVAVSGAQPATQAQPGVVGEAQSPPASVKQTPSQTGAQQGHKVSVPPPVASKPNFDRQSLQAQVLPLASVQKGSASPPSSPAVPPSQEQMLFVAPVAVVQPFQQGGAQVKMSVPNRNPSQPEQSSAPVAAAGTAGQIAATIGPGSSGDASANQKVHEPPKYINMVNGEVQISIDDAPAAGVNDLNAGVASSMNLFLPNLLESLTTLTLVFLPEELGPGVLIHCSDCMSST